MRADGSRASIFACLALVAACGARTEPWSLGGGTGGRSPTATGGIGGFGAGTGISTGAGGGGAGTGTGGTGTGTGGTGTGTGGVGTGTGGTNTGSGGAATGTGGDSGAGGTGAGGSGTGGGAGRGGSGGAGGVGGTGAGGSPPDASLPCLGRVIQTGLGFTFYFLMEKSASMGTVEMTTGVSRWTASERAISAFATPATRAGLGFFPESTGSAACSAVTYTTPSVPLSQASQQSTVFDNAMRAQTLGGSAPTAPALEGALSYAAERAKVPYRFSPPISAPSVILVTDGEPDMCNGTVDSTAAVAAAAFNATPRIKTFVIAVGNAGDRLDPIARAGGTSRAFVGTTPGSSLDAVLKSRTYCEITLPIDEDAGTAVTRMHVQTNLRPADGGPVSYDDPLTFLRQVPGPGACGVEGGWFLDSPSLPTLFNPALVLVCPDTCRALADNEESRIVVWRACDPI